METLTSKITLQPKVQIAAPTATPVVPTSNSENVGNPGGPLPSPVNESPKQQVQIPLSLVTKIESIQQVMLTAHPRLPGLLREIHKVLKDDPAIVTLLSEEQIGMIVQGLAQHTNVELAGSALKKSSTKALKNMTLDDL